MNWWRLNSPSLSLVYVEKPKESSLKKQKTNKQTENILEQISKNTKSQNTKSTHKIQLLSCILTSNNWNLKFKKAIQFRISFKN